MKKKRKTIVYDYDLTKAEIETFEKDHPGYRLAFTCRHPHFSLYISALSVFCSIIALIAPIIIRIFL